MPTEIVLAWRHALARCATAGVHVLVRPMGKLTPSRVLARDGVCIIVLNHGLSLTDRLRELERQLFALRLSSVLT